MLHTLQSGTVSQSLSYSHGLDAFYEYRSVISEMPFREGLSNVGMIGVTRCIFDRMTAEVRPCFSIVRFILNEIRMKTVLIYCALTMGQHRAKCFI